MLKDTTKLTVKDLQNLLSVSSSTAKRYYKDIKLEFELKIITYQHFKKYFKVS